MKKKVKRKKKAKRDPRIRLVSVDDGSFKRLATDICHDAISLAMKEWRDQMTSIMDRRIEEQVERFTHQLLFKVREAAFVVLK